MNRNIEVINENLWAVNMGYVESNFIQDLNLISGKTTGHINLTDKGTLIIDKASKLYPAMERLLPDIMQKTTDELQSVIECVQHPEALDALDDLIVNLCGWELKRRSVREQWLIEHSF